MRNGVCLRFLFLLGGLLLLSACGEGPQLQGSPDAPTVFVPSTSWQQSVSPEVYDQRVSSLTAAVERLRAETSSGWVARQDDVTGYVAQLRGGSYGGSGAAPEDQAADFLDAYGTELFGVTSQDIRFSEDAPADAAGMVVLRGEQHVGDVPVLDAVLTVAVSPVASEQRVTLINGRVFAGVDAATEPRIRPRAAARAAVRSTRLATSGVDGGPRVTVQGEPELVVVATAETAVLTWRVTIVGEGAEDIFEVFVNAEDGSIVRSRPVRIGLGPDRVPRGLAGESLAQAAPQGEAVEVTGTSPTGDAVVGTGLRTDAGTVELRDTTTPSFDPATGEGGIETYDARGLANEGGLPGEIATSDTPAVADGAAIGAHAFSRYVYDYYRTVFGRNSWDNEGGTLTSAVNFGGTDYCNAFFSSSLSPPQMVYGEGCVEGGEPAVVTYVDVDVAGHEITHGVIDTTGGLNYTGQSGALNESFADYFGNLIGNAYKGVDTAEAFEGACDGLPGPTSSCSESPEGGLTFRYLLNGATMGDYLSVVDPPIRYGVVGIAQDQGGVHLNSAIWNNALWSIRSRLAQIDGVSGNESPRARTFDQIVYAALDRYLTPAAGFLDARAAVEQAALDAQAEPVIQDTIREIFDLNLICAGCVPGAAAQASPVTTTAATQKVPSVAANRVLWVDGGERLGQVAEAGLGAAPTTINDPDTTVAVAPAGDATVSMELGPGDQPAVVYRPAGGGASQPLDTPPEDLSFITGVAGSAEGAAWANFGEEILGFVDPQGQVTTAPMPADYIRSLENGPSLELPLFSLATGGRTVALGSTGGEILVWTVGEEPRVVTTLEQPILSLGVYGDRALAVTLNPSQAGGGLLPLGSALVVDLTNGTTTTVSDSAIGIGAAVSDEYVVWPQAVGTLGGVVARNLEGRGTTAPDTDLFMYSLRTGQTYSLLAQRGQQAFPQISGTRLVWQDAVNGGDDVYTSVIPPGL